MSVRSLLIVVAVVSFSLTFGIGLWERNRAELPTPQPDSLSSAAQLRRRADSQATANIRPIAPEVAPQSSVPETQPANVEAHADSPYPEEGSEMPIQLDFLNRAKDRKLVAKVFNSASHALVVEVQISSASRGTRDSQITIAPNGKAILGGDDGVDLQSGDQVTLLSRPYADKVAQAP